jgi:hypothetical protein
MPQVCGGGSWRRIDRKQNTRDIVTMRILSVPYAVIESRHYMDGEVQLCNLFLYAGPLARSAPRAPYFTTSKTLTFS